VTHHASVRFWRYYRGLPHDVRELADKNYELLKSDPFHRSLHLKKIGPYWSVRVGLHYRALAVEAGGDRVWFWIGSHAEYDKLVGRPPANAVQPMSRAPRKGRPRKPSRAARG
jgi:hypothetical protein